MMTTKTIPGGKQGGIQQDFDRDGFVRIRGFLSPEELAEVRENLQRFGREMVPALPVSDRVFEADGKTVRNLFRIERYDPFFKALAERSDIRRLIASLVHGEPELLAVETFNKPPRVGSGVPPHQDNAYFCQSPPDVLTVWIAMDAATLANGPIYYLKGSHRNGLLPHRSSGVAGNSMGLAFMPPHDAAAEFCGTLEPGDALIHHCQTIHWSAANKTDHPRCGLLIVYRGAHTVSAPELREEYARGDAPLTAPLPAGVQSR